MIIEEDRDYDGRTINDDHNNGQQLQWMIVTMIRMMIVRPRVLMEADVELPGV